MLSGKEVERLGINPKLPTWDGSWSGWASYKLQVELELDGTHKDDKVTLGPRLVRNLTGRAWESVTEIDRAKLKQETGVGYMLEFLESKRGNPRLTYLEMPLASTFSRVQCSGKMVKPGVTTRPDMTTWFVT